MGKKRVTDPLDVHNLRTPLMRALWAIDQMTNGDSDRFSASEISNYLVEKCRVPASRQAITETLRKAKTLCHKNLSGYKLMEDGRRSLASSESASDGIHTIMIEAGKPFTAKRVDLAKVFSGLKGTIRICDPYVDVRTLDLLFTHLASEMRVLILTSNIIDKPSGAFARYLNDLRAEGYQVEVGVYGRDLHDRYIIDDTVFWHSGNSLNHLGNKESFITRLGDDVRQSMRALFDTRWKTAVKK